MMNKGLKTVKTRLRLMVRMMNDEHDHSTNSEDYEGARKDYGHKDFHNVFVKTVGLVRGVSLNHFHPLKCV